MSESEIEGFLNKVESGLVEAQHDMLVEKALYNRPVVISDGNGGVVEVHSSPFFVISTLLYCKDEACSPEPWIQMPKFCKVAVSVMPRVATSDTCVVMRMPLTEDGLLPGVRLSSCEQLDIRRRAQAIWGNKLDNFIFISFNIHLSPKC